MANYYDSRHKRWCKESVISMIKLISIIVLVWAKNISMMTLCHCNLYILSILLCYGLRADLLIYGMLGFGLPILVLPVFRRKIVKIEWIGICRLFFELERSNFIIESILLFVQNYKRKQVSIYYRFWDVKPKTLQTGEYKNKKHQMTFESLYDA